MSISASGSPAISVCRSLATGSRVPRRATRPGPDSQVRRIDHDACTRHGDFRRSIETQWDVAVAAGESGERYPDLFGQKFYLGRQVGGEFRSRCLHLDVDAGGAIALGRGLQGGQSSGALKAAGVEGEVRDGAASRVVDMPLEFERACSHALTRKVCALNGDVQPARGGAWIGRHLGNQRSSQSEHRQSFYVLQLGDAQACVTGRLGLGDDKTGGFEDGRRPATLHAGDREARGCVVRKASVQREGLTGDVARGLERSGEGAAGGQHDRRIEGQSLGVDGLESDVAALELQRERRFGTAEPDCRFRGCCALDPGTEGRQPRQVESEVQCTRLFASPAGDAERAAFTAELRVPQRPASVRRQAGRTSQVDRSDQTWRHVGCPQLLDTALPAGGKVALVDVCREIDQGLAGERAARDGGQGFQAGEIDVGAHFTSVQGWCVIAVAFEAHERHRDVERADPDFFTGKIG